MPPRTDGPYAAFPLEAAGGWIIVGRLDADVTEGADALFRPEHLEIAQEFADRLNVRELAGRS